MRRAIAVLPAGTASDLRLVDVGGLERDGLRRLDRAAALAGLAGAFLAMRALINPYAGPTQLIFAFEAVVIGGIGSLWGTLVGGIVLGVAQSFGATISAQGFQLAGHLVFLVVLGARLYLAHSRNLGGWRAVFRLTQAPRSSPLTSVASEARS